MSDAGPAPPEKKPRLLSIDNLRILVISLVIVSHCSITCGGPGGRYPDGCVKAVSRPSQ